MVWQTNMSVGTGSENQQMWMSYGAAGQGIDNELSGKGSEVSEQAPGKDSSESMKTDSSQPDVGSQASTSSERLGQLQMSLKSEPVEQTSLQSLQNFVNFSDRSTNGNATQNEMPGNNVNTGSNEGEFTV